MSTQTQASPRAGKRTLTAARGGRCEFPHTIPGDSMVLLSRNFPRTFPFQSESRRGGNPNGFLTTESVKETSMANCYCTQSYHDSQNWESPIPLKIYNNSRVIGGVL